MIPPASPWYTVFRPHPAPGLRLICLPYAGAGAAAFRAWPETLAALHPAAEVVAVRLPGRESRMRERCETHMAAIIPPLLAAIQPLVNNHRFVLFGHSLGASIAHDLALALAAQDRPPALLVLSGRRPPHLPPRRLPYHTLDEKAFRQQLARMGGTPPEVLASDDLMDLLAPMVRADFCLAETYRRDTSVPIPCPVLACSGADDPEAPPDDVAAWRELAGAGFEHLSYPGGHFFLHPHGGAMLEAIVHRVAAQVSPSEFQRR